MSGIGGVTPVRVALAGCGTVGGALLDLLATHGEAIASQRGMRFEVVRILARNADRPRSVAMNRALVTSCVAEFSGTPADVVVEAIGGTQPAEAIARAALTRGQGLVTANKALLRAHGSALAALARAQSTPGAALRFEAAVGGGVPVVRLLRDALAGHGVQSVRGVLNGTTNFIVTRIERGASYAEALDAARRAGFAEADPSRDLNGTDAADKIAVLAWLAFGVDPERVAVETCGLPDDLERAVRDAKAAGGALRLVAEVRRSADGIVASVQPIQLERSDPLAAARDEESIIQIASASSGTITLGGRGAGGAATAASLLADLIHLYQPRHS